MKYEEAGGFIWLKKKKKQGSRVVLNYKTMKARTGSRILDMTST